MKQSKLKKKKNMHIKILQLSNKNIKQTIHKLSIKYLVYVHFLERGLQDFEILNIFVFQVSSKFNSLQNNAT